MCQSVRVWDRGWNGFIWASLPGPPGSGDGELRTLVQHLSCLSLEASTPKNVGRFPQTSWYNSRKPGLSPRDTVPNFISQVEVSAHPAHCDTLSGYKKCSAPI